MPQLDFSFFVGDLFWLIVCFVSLFLFMKYLIIPRIEKIFTIRKEYINSTVNESSNLNDEISRINEEINELKIETKLKEEHIIESAKSQADEFFYKKLANLEKKLDLEVNASKSEIKIFKEDFYQNSKDQIIQLSKYILERVSGIDADTKTLNHYFNKFKN